MKEVIPFIHIFCTSEDVNNLSYQIGLRDALNEVILPKLRGIIQSLVVLVDKHKGDVILGRTH
jgi:adenylosuccinate lyase